MWQALARCVRPDMRRRLGGRTRAGRPAFGWMAIALLVLVMQTAGLAHRIQHGDAASPGVAAAVAMAAVAGSDGAPDASTDAPSPAHLGHSCVLFDGDSLFVGGACLPPSLTRLRVTQLAPRSFAALPVDLAPLRAFHSRAPPRGGLSS